MPAWTDFWLLQVVGQTLVCLGLGYLISARLQARPSRTHLMLLFTLVAAIVAPLVGGGVRLANAGIWAGPAESDVFFLPNDLDKDLLATFRRLATPVILVSCATVSSVLLLRLMVAYVRGCRLVADSKSVFDRQLLQMLARARAHVGLNTQPELCCHEAVRNPMVWAWSRAPIVLIPVDAAEQLPGLDWESIFIHELAHVARRDHLTSILGDIVVSLLFWNPLAWLVRRQLAKQGEFCCDEYVAAAGLSPVEFAATLLAVRRQAVQPLIPAAHLDGGNSWLKQRIERLLHLNEEPIVRPGMGWSGAVISTTLLLIVALALVQPRHAPRPAETFAGPLTAPVEPTAE
jgi:beta-lactamase regulating signal transducer with metallopeptidase domain